MGTFYDLILKPREESARRFLGENATCDTFEEPQNELLQCHPGLELAEQWRRAKTLLDEIAPYRPAIVAHRGGPQGIKAFENSLAAFESAMRVGVDAIELDIYIDQKQPAEVLVGRGVEKGGKAERLALRQVLQNIPEIPIILDIKSPQTIDLLIALQREVPPEEWSRLLIYSTETEHIQLARTMIPYAQTFEPREITQERLFNLDLSLNEFFPRFAKVLLGFNNGLEILVSQKVSLGEVQSFHQIGENRSPQSCYPALAGPAVGFENDVTVAVTQENLAGKLEASYFATRLWNELSIQCIRNFDVGVAIFIFGINSPGDLRNAIQLGADAVYTDYPGLLLESL